MQKAKLGVMPEHAQPPKPACSPMEMQLCWRPVASLLPHLHKADSTSTDGTQQSQYLPNPPLCWDTNQETEFSSLHLNSEEQHVLGYTWRWTLLTQHSLISPRHPK